MAHGYPLVEQREYGTAQLRGSWLTKRRTRDDGDLPRIAAHQVRVFRVGDEYVEDPGQARPGDGLAVTASSVTVVDRRVGVPIVVETGVPSGEVGDFTMRTTFHCTVTDACAVVRDGVTDVEALLLGYLRGIPGLVEDGGDLRIVDAAQARRRLEARLTAYQEMRRPEISGLRVLPVAVEVLTPAELAEHVRAMEDERLALERDRVSGERAQERARWEAEKDLLLEELGRKNDLVKELNRQERETLRNRYEREEGAEGQEYELGRKRLLNRFRRQEVAEDRQLIGDDPAAADLNALHNGDIDSDTVAARMREDRAQRYERADHLAQLKQEYLERIEALEREENRTLLERDDRAWELRHRANREEAAAKRLEEGRRWDREQDDAVRRRQAEREEAQLQRQEQREWADRLLSANHDLKARAIDRGLLDDTSTDMGAFINSVGDVSPAAAGPRKGAADPQLEKVAVERADRPKDAEVVAEQTDEESDGDVRDGGGDDNADGADDIGPAGLEEHVGH
ncbi:hypothetical protein ACN2WE_19495 [Streptomyces sp. cg28]|uniref:hypothetical protein n=1 Tax=Streptomyces sp. cg28 TaxID=3403457 RepID=UPI003B2197B9